MMLEGWQFFYFKRAFSRSKKLLLRSTTTSQFKTHSQHAYLCQLLWN